MKLIIRIILIGAITYFISPFSGWWVCMGAAFIVLFVSPSSGLNSFIAGFLGVGLVWMGHAWSLDVANKSAFSLKIGEIMGINDPIYLVLATGAIGGIAGGFSALTGTNFKSLIIKSKSKSLYS